MRVWCEVSEIEIEGEYTTVSGTEVTCGRCGHTTESYGTSDASIRRCLALMREECPEDEQNFYVARD
jgi:tRNA(Ile2) C34 agmatinyltransferase TiaS